MSEEQAACTVAVKEEGGGRLVEEEVAEASPAVLIAVPAVGPEECAFVQKRCYVEEEPLGKAGGINGEDESVVLGRE